MTLQVGERAPEFTLPGVEGVRTDHEQRRDFSLSEFLGSPVVLIFYPGDNTPVCTRQLTTYSTDLSQFDEVGAKLLAISPQSVESHAGFSCKQGGFGFPLLADTDKAVGEQYGVLGPMGFYRRSAFVIDASGSVSYAHRAVAGLTFRPVSELVAAVAASAAS